MYQICFSLMKRHSQPDAVPLQRTGAAGLPRSLKSVSRRLVLSLLFASVIINSLRMNVHADDLGMWYYDEFGVKEAHEAGIDGSGIKIADIDTMVNADVPWLADANLVIREKNITTFYGDVSPVTDDFNKAYHATDMLSLLQGNGQGATAGNAPLGIIPGAQIYHYSAVHSDDDSITGGDIYDEGVRLALEDNVDIILIPAGGLSFYDRQYPYLLEAIKRGIPVLVAHSNERIRLDETLHPEYYQDAAGVSLSADDFITSDPEDEICYWPGLVTVQCLNSNRQLQIISDVEDPGTDIAAPGENIWMQFYNWGNFEPSGGGCSAATTVAGGYLTLAMQKWPDATGNQILQLLIATADNSAQNTENTTRSDESSTDFSDINTVTTLTRDSKRGFGVINLQKMLDTDPTGFPDVNPILYMDIYKTVNNAGARGVTDKLTEDENLMEIAAVLEEQLVSAELPRPDFLVTLLGEREGSGETAESDEGTQASENLSASGAEEQTAASETTITPAPVTAKKGFPVATISLSIALGVGLLLIIIILIRHGKKKKDTEEQP